MLKTFFFLSFHYIKKRKKFINLQAIIIFILTTQKINYKISIAIKIINVEGKIFFDNLTIQ